MKYILMNLFVLLTIFAFAQASPKVKNGEQAINFKLEQLDGTSVELNKLNSSNNVVLVVLRGYPEKQCPACSRQVGQYIGAAQRFEDLNAKLLLIYPGPTNVIQDKATEFADVFTFPDNFNFALDPDYSMVNKYGLRWDAPKETAYPSTFVINKNGEIVYSKISSTHGGRADVEELLEELEKL